MGVALSYISPLLYKFKDVNHCTKESDVTVPLMTLCLLSHNGYRLTTESSFSVSDANSSELLELSSSVRFLVLILEAVLGIVWAFVFGSLIGESVSCDLIGVIRF